MNLDDFLEEQKKIEKLPINAQKKFYEKLLNKKHDKTELYVYVGFAYGKLYYQEGSFRRTIEIIEPLVVDYQNYPYTPKMISCFNLIGVATHCETQYSVSRFFYETALQIAQENEEKYYYAFEYNNIALTYIAEKNYDEALVNLASAEAFLKDSDEAMGAYVYLNKSISLQKLERLEEAQESFDRSLGVYHADEIIPDDVIRCATTLYYRLGKMTRYEEYKHQILSKMKEMYAAEFMDACVELFACGLDAGDEALMGEILQAMDQYMDRYPQEIRVGLAFSNLKYEHAIKQEDIRAILKALEEKNEYEERINKSLEANRVKTLRQFIDINTQIADLELDALTGFKNRKAYYKDVALIERDEDKKNHPVGVVFADVNGLKQINDSMGHNAGDSLIASVAEKLASVFSKARWYRFGGDEFVILSFDENETIFRDKLQKLAGLWQEDCSASIGSVWVEHARDIENSVSLADEKMYQDKIRHYENKNRKL